MRTKTTLVALTLSLMLASGALGQQTSGPSPVLIPTRPSTQGDFFYKTELYMGLSIPGGGTVSYAAWEDFLAEFVTPRFPDGFTVLDGRGQYREASGTIAKEPSHVLVFLYKRPERQVARARIE